MTTALVATIGGHISELVELADRLPERERIWVTSETPQTVDLLAGHDVEFVPAVGERDLLGVLRAIPRAWRLYRRHRVDRVVSTGSAIALAYLPVAAALGLDAHYIESSARIESCSVTGRILSRIPGVTCWWQYDPAPPRFEPLRGVHDRYLVSPRRTPNGGEPEIRHVVVTVGTTSRCFRRLIARLVEILPPEAEVLWQTGASRVDDLGIEAHRLVPADRLKAAMASADVVVAHAGAGSLATALRSGHVPVLVPRRLAEGEQIDDHQVELARWADGRGLAVMAEADRLELDDLRRAARWQVHEQPTEGLILMETARRPKAVPGPTAGGLELGPRRNILRRSRSCGRRGVER